MLNDRPPCSRYLIARCCHIHRQSDNHADKSNTRAEYLDPMISVKDCSHRRLTRNCDYEAPVTQISRQNIKTSLIFF